MTFQAARFLRKLKKAQVHQDWSILIDYDKFTAATYNYSPKNTTVVNLSRYRNSLHSIMHELEQRKFIKIGSLGHVSITHAGWCAFGITVQGALKFTIRDIIIPIITAIATTLVLRYI